MEKLVRAESGFNRFAIGVNGATHRSYHPSSQEEATRIARDLIDKGHSKIVHITGPEGNILTRDRLSGYVQAMSDGESMRTMLLPPSSPPPGR